jgi:hypothetical protein
MNACALHHRVMCSASVILRRMFRGQCGRRLAFNTADFALRCHLL